MVYIKRWYRYFACRWWIQSWWWANYLYLIHVCQRHMFIHAYILWAIMRWSCREIYLSGAFFSFHKRTDSDENEFDHVLGRQKDGKKKCNKDPMYYPLRFAIYGEGGSVEKQELLLEQTISWLSSENSQSRGFRRTSLTEIGNGLVVWYDALLLKNRKLKTLLHYVLSPKHNGVLKLKLR